MSYLRFFAAYAFWLVLTVWVPFKNAHAQVGNKAYDLMLRRLLTRNVPEVTVTQLANRSSEVTLLDARERPEYAVSHLQDAIWVGYEQFDTAAVSSLPRDQPVVVYCSVGYRSEKITQRLLQMGFTQVSNLYGGIFEWVNQGQPLYQEGVQTHRVHGYSRAWGIWLQRGEKVFGDKP